MSRIKFKKDYQRRFLKEILIALNCPSLRAINQFGFGIPYSTLKNYMNESRTIPEELFINLCSLAKINPESFDKEKLPENWGQVKGGKVKYSR
ncbi:MAG: hypothetical protein M1165_01420 [Candidatus Pacearchaeota archaeon]|jgi:hypothetical protein|nr:hypothetical protein [Candidatus Pacearchaeota archaeon]